MSVHELRLPWTKPPASANDRDHWRVKARKVADIRQTVARLVFEPLTERPTRLYGEGGSHYQKQGLKLSKHFRPWS